MSPRHFKLLVVMLPLFVARSLLPFGFMLSFEAGTAQLVFCPGQTTIPGHKANLEPAVAVTHQGHEHHHGATHEAAGDVEADHQACPFALAGAAPLYVPAAFAPEPPAFRAIAEPPQSAIIVGALGAHLIRGPPALS